jgi:hypothetical protein
VTGTVLRCSPVPSFVYTVKSSRVTPFQAVQYFAEHGQCALFRSRVCPVRQQAAAF